MGIIDISTEIEPTVFVSMNKILKYFLPLSHTTSRARSMFYLSDLDVSISLEIHHNFLATLFCYKKRNTHVL